MRRVAKSGYLPYLTRMHAHRSPPLCLPAPSVCVVCVPTGRISASHVRSVVSRTRFELHLICSWVGGMRLCRQAVFRVGSQSPFRLRNMGGIGGCVGIDNIRARQASLIRASCHAMSRL